ncbi:hypothetical protein BASA81_012887 [Batrachochytrium salamandrivorans]|nr:hypothetical protein BASA81_012887 [Batrachochytrium salamandrivorans]
MLHPRHHHHRELISALRLLELLRHNQPAAISPDTFPSFPVWCLGAYPLPSAPRLNRIRPADHQSIISPPFSVKRMKQVPTPPLSETKEEEGEEEEEDEEASVGKFLMEFSETHKVRSLEFASLGDFDMPRDQVQFFGSSQPIPNNVRVTFSMFLEKWETTLRYTRCPLTDQVVLQFDVKSLRTGKVVSKTETGVDVLRRKHKRATIICNKVFEEAWRELQGDPRAKCSTKESGTLFGLKDPRMKLHVLQWYQAQGQTV